MQDKSRAQATPGSIGESAQFAETPESDKFVIQDTELKNQQAYLAGANESNDVSEFRYSPKGARAEEIQVNLVRDTVVQNADLLKQLQSPEPPEPVQRENAVDDSELRSLSPEEERAIYARELYRVLVEEGPAQNLISAN